MDDHRGRPRQPRRRGHRDHARSAALHGGYPGAPRRHQARPGDGSGDVGASLPGPTRKRRFSSSRIPASRERSADDIGWTKDPSMLARFAVPGDPNGARRQHGSTHHRPDQCQGCSRAATSWRSATLERRRMPPARSPTRSGARTSMLQFRPSVTLQPNPRTGTKRKPQGAATAEYCGRRPRLSSSEQHGVIMADDKTDLDTQRLAALSGAGAAPVAAPVAR